MMVFFRKRPRKILIWQKFSFSNPTIKTPERQNKSRLGVLFVNFEQISDLVLVLFFLTLNM